MNVGSTQLLKKEKITDFKAYHAVYREANRERMRINYNKWRSANIEKAQNNSKKWAERNRERLRADMKAWRAANSDKELSYRYKRRALQKQSIIEKFLVTEIYERDGWICQLCGKRVNKKLKHPNPLSPSLDHIIPVNSGGSHTRDNVHLAHLLCNLRAGTRGIKQTRLF